MSDMAQRLILARVALAPPNKMLCQLGWSFAAESFVEHGTKVNGLEGTCHSIIVSQIIFAGAHQPR